MRRLPLAVLVALAPLATTAAEPALPPMEAGFTATAAMGGGGELGLKSGKAGVLELEAAMGWEFQSLGLRPELAAALGVAPDSHLAFRPGVRWTIPGFPIQLRAAVDASNARSSDFHWRWLLIGAAGEVRITSLLGFYGEIDTGAPLGSGAGLPLLLRAGASFRF
ncbi:MAG TPA: hypothetical protein VIW03_10530 [Anaeromyxobacter sp.]